MRVFNDFERGIIRQAIKLDEKPGSLNTLNNLINKQKEPDIPDYCYVSIEHPGAVKLMIMQSELTRHGADFVKTLDKSISKKLLTIVELFYYLKTERLAFFNGNLDLKVLGKKVEGVDYTGVNFGDIELANYVFRDANKRIYISDTLKKIANNNFKTDEQILREKEINSQKWQLRCTQIGLALTVAALASSIYLTKKNTSTILITNKEIPVSINGAQAQLLQQTADDVAGMKALLKGKVKLSKIRH